MIDAGEIVQAIVEVGALIGQDLLPLFQEKIPALRTDPLPDATGDMNAARDAAEARSRLGPSDAKK